MIEKLKTGDILMNTFELNNQERSTINQLYSKNGFSDGTSRVIDTLSEKIAKNANNHVISSSDYHYSPGYATDMSRSLSRLNRFGPTNSDKHFGKQHEELSFNNNRAQYEVSGWTESQGAADNMISVTCDQTQQEPEVITTCKGELQVNRYEFIRYSYHSQEFTTANSSTLIEEITPKILALIDNKVDLIQKGDTVKLITNNDQGNSFFERYAQTESLEDTLSSLELPAPLQPQNVEPQISVVAVGVAAVAGAAVVVCAVKQALSNLNQCFRGKNLTTAQKIGHFTQAAFLLTGAVAITGYGGFALGSIGRH